MAIYLSTPLHVTFFLNRDKTLEARKQGNMTLRFGKAIKDNSRVDYRPYFSSFFVSTTEYPLHPELKGLIEEVEWHERVRKYNDRSRVANTLHPAGVHHVVDATVIFHPVGWSDQYVAIRAKNLTSLIVAYAEFYPEHVLQEGRGR